MKERDTVKEQKELLKTLQRLVDNDEAFFHELTDEIGIYQPFIIPMMLALPEKKFSMEVCSDWMRLYLLVWSYFRKFPSVKMKELSDEAYYEKYNEQINIVKSIGAEQDPVEKIRIGQKNVLEIKSLYLFTLIFGCTQEWPNLMALQKQDSFNELMHLKSLIMALDEIAESV